MKKLILAAITTACAASVFAQGTVSFVNRSSGGTTHVYYTPGIHSSIQGNTGVDSPSGATDYSAGLLIGTTGSLNGPTTFAQLLGANGAGAAESSLLPSTTGITTFRTGAGAGFVALTTATFGNIPADAAVASLEMVAWDNSSGLYPTWAQASLAWSQGLIAAGRSAEFNVSSIGGGNNTPPNINPGLTSFNVFTTIPEPTTAALAGLGAAAMLIFRRRK